MAATAPRTSAALLLRPAPTLPVDDGAAAALESDEEEPLSVEDGEMVELACFVLLSVARVMVVLLRVLEEPVTPALRLDFVAVALLSLELRLDATLERLDETEETLEDTEELRLDADEDTDALAEAVAEPPEMAPTFQKFGAWPS